MHVHAGTNVSDGKPDNLPVLSDSISVGNIRHCNFMPCWNFFSYFNTGPEIRTDFKNSCCQSDIVVRMQA
jgi:hypothetical protein